MFLRTVLCVFPIPCLHVVRVLPPSISFDFSSLSFRSTYYCYLCPSHPFRPLSLSPFPPSPKLTLLHPQRNINRKCDANFNLNTVLRANILSSNYFKALYDYKSYHEVMHEIEREVTHVAPFSAGKQRLPSTAFCLLYKFFTMGLTEKQLKGLLEHKESAYVKAVAVLYVRFMLSATDMWTWLSPLLEDNQKFKPGSAVDDPEMTIAEFVEMVLSGNNLYGTVMPRIPALAARNIKNKLLVRKVGEELTSSNEKYLSELKPGMECEALYREDGKYYKATIDEVRDEGRLLITFTEYGNQEEVSVGEIKVPDSLRSSSRSGDGTSAAGGSGSDVRASKRKYGKRKVKASRSRSRSLSPESRFRKLEEAERRKEKEKAVASRKSDYMRRPTNLKQALSMELSVGTSRRRSRTPPRRRTSRRDREKRSRSRSRSRSPAKKKVSTEAAERLKKLKERYGDASTKDGTNSDYK